MSALKQIAKRFLTFSSKLIVDGAYCTFTRNNNLFPCIGKRPSSIIRGLIILFHCSCTSCIRRHFTQKVPILFCQNHVFEDVSSILRDPFIYPLNDDHTLHSGTAYIRLVGISSIQLFVCMDRFTLGTSFTEPFLSIFSRVCVGCMYAVVAWSRLFCKT